MCARNAVSFHTGVVSKSKIVRKMRCFTIERLWVGANVGGVRRRVRLWSPMSEYGRTGPP